LNASGGTLTWSTSSNLTIVGGQGTKTLTVTAVGSGGSGFVTCSYNNGCRTVDFTKNIDQVGPYSAAQVIVSGQAAVCPGNSYTYTANTPPGAQSFSWTFPSGWTVQSQWQNTITLSVPNPNSQYGTVMASVTNACGTSPFAGITVYPDWSCGGCCSFTFSPNPSQDEVVVELAPETADNPAAKDISFQSYIYDNTNSILKRGQSKSGKIIFDVRDLKNGEYFVEAVAGDVRMIERLVVRH
jgi:hypothetical protein